MKTKSHLQPDKIILYGLRKYHEANFEGKGIFSSETFGSKRLLLPSSLPPVYLIFMRIHESSGQGNDSGKIRKFKQLNFYY